MSFLFTKEFICDVDQKEMKNSTLGHEADGSNELNELMTEREVCRARMH